MAFRSRGLPSRGCNRCRSKKIRCDETKPICQNCSKVAYTECKYRDEFERTWRIHTEETVMKTKQPKSPACPIISRFFFDFTSGTPPAPGVSISWFDALPSIYTHADPDSLLHRSVRALAHANYGKRCGDAEALAKGSEMYGEALRVMRQTIASDIDVPKRDILASVILLGIHEAFVDPSISPSGSWLSHMGGASVLMKRQPESDEVASSPIDLQIRSMIFRQVVRLPLVPDIENRSTALFFADMPYEYLKLHGSFLSARRPAISWEDDLTLQNPHLKHVTEHSRLLHQAAVLFSEWRLAFADAQSPSGLERLAVVAVEAIELDRELDLWARTLPPAFAYEVEPIIAPAAPEWFCDLLNFPGAPRFSHGSGAPLSEMLWRFYWAARMILCQALLHTNLVLNSTSSPTNPLQRQEHEIESCLLHVIDRSIESCVSPLMRAANQADPDKLQTEKIPSIRGYLMLQLLPTIDLCLGQITLRTIQADLEGRRSWVNAMREVLRLRLGFSKAAAEVDRARLQTLPVQLWGLANDASGL